MSKLKKHNQIVSPELRNFYMHYINNLDIWMPESVLNIKRNMCAISIYQRLRTPKALVFNEIYYHEEA